MLIMCAELCHLAAGTDIDRDAVNLIEVSGLCHLHAYLTNPSLSYWGKIFFLYSFTICMTSEKDSRAKVCVCVIRVACPV